MAIIVSQIKSDISSSSEDIINNAIKKLKLNKASVLSASVHKTSLDARKHYDIHLVSSVYLELSDNNLEEKLTKTITGCSCVESTQLIINKGSEKLKGRIVIAGFGPAGMFAALTLAENGYKPIVLERGADVDNRVLAVENFWNNKVLDKNSNVQFGEGGAGTFSDGKLTTRIKDPLCSHVLKKLVEFGAPQEILTKAKPHIGTDKLRYVVKNLRERIISLGGEIHFLTSVNDITIEDDTLKYVKSQIGEIDTQALVLAIGHSARDTFEMLYNKNVFMQVKPFSVGARIEHSQISVNKSLYGVHYNNPNLPQGEYQLSYRTNDRCVYTFCMCPGGFVVPSSSEEETVVVNGMSEFSRNQKNANSALVVSVSEKDFGDNPIDAIKFQQKIERNAFISGGSDYSAPISKVSDFLEDRITTQSGGIIPSYSIGTKAADFNEFLPNEIINMMKVGIRNFASKMKCFGEAEAILTGPETRTSSPIRISRGENLESVSIKNIYPCGEGAGYAGGIMSSAVDGIKVATKIIEKYSEN